MPLPTSSLFFSSLRLRRGLLAVAVAALAAGAAVAQSHPHGPEGHMGGGPFMLGGPGLHRALDAVKATDEQRAQIRQIVEAARNDLRAQHETGRGLREQAMQVFTQPTVDANAAEAVRQKMLAHHDQESRRMLQAMLDVSRVLTPEQRVQLGQRLAQRREMMQRHEQERRALDGGQRQ